jgi:hypothetical protein
MRGRGMDTENHGFIGDRQVRAAQNQALFREVNERIESLNEPFATEPSIGQFVCECADETCSDAIAVTVTEYERVRGDGSRFIVAPAEAHYVPAVERVVEKHERFWVVEKFEDGGRVAARLNPRTRTRLADG